MKLIAALCLVILLCPLPAIAGQAQAQATTPLKSKQRPVCSDKVLACAATAAALAVPGLPNYPGQVKFLMGTRSPNTNGGAYIALHYSAKEEQKDIIDWYLQAARNYKWNIDRRDGTVSSIMLNNSAGAICTIGVTNPTTTGYRSDIFLMFRQDGRMLTSCR